MDNISMLKQDLSAAETKLARLVGKKRKHEDKWAASARITRLAETWAVRPLLDTPSDLGGSGEIRRKRSW